MQADAPAFFVVGEDKGYYIYALLYIITYELLFTYMIIHALLYKSIIIHAI